MAVPAERFVFVVTPREGYEGDRKGLLAGLTAADEGETQPAQVYYRDLLLINGLAAEMTVEQAVRLTKDSRVRQVWYLHPDLAEVYVNLIRALDYGVKTYPLPAVANLSLGPPASVMPMAAFPDDPMNEATRIAAEQGYIPVFAAGNYRTADGRNDGVINPWCLPDWVICVGAANSDGTEVWVHSASGSSQEPALRPDVVAPGVDIVGTFPMGRPKGKARKARDESNPVFRAQVPEEKWHLYTLESGTSQAAPHVALALAQILHFLKGAVDEFGSTPQPLFATEMPRERYENASKGGNRVTGTITLQTEDTVEVTYSVDLFWKLGRQLLIDTAIPMPSFPSELVGAGFVDVEYVAQQFGEYGRVETKIGAIRVVN